MNEQNPFTPNDTDTNNTNQGQTTVNSNNIQSNGVTNQVPGFYPQENPVQTPSQVMPTEISNQAPTQTVEGPKQDENVELNKQDAMEEALSHTTKFSPFEAPVSETSEEEKKDDTKSILVFVILVAVIIGLFIFLLPQITELLGK